MAIRYGVQFTNLRQYRATLRRAGKPPVRKWMHGAARTFALTLRRRARVDKGALKASVGSRGAVAGYAILGRQREGKQFSAPNRRAYFKALGLAGPRIRVGLDRQLSQWVQRFNRRRAR